MERNKKTGVYAIVNKLDGCMYIGSSVDIGRRYSQHIAYCYGRTKRGSYNLKMAVLRDGLENFELRVLEECKKSILLERERFWIVKERPAYNVSADPLHPILSRDKTKLRPKELWKKKDGHKQTVETREKISNTLKGRRPTDACLEKSRMLHKKRVLLLDFNGENIIFESLTACSEHLGISVKHASLIKSENTLFRKRYKIQDYV